jgi:hypothetical protein
MSGGCRESLKNIDGKFDMDEYTAKLIEKHAVDTANKMVKNEQVIGAVFDELRRAEELHPGWPENVFEQMAIIGEEFGEMQQAAIDFKYHRGRQRRLYEEAVQVAAMSLRFLFNYKD